MKEFALCVAFQLQTLLACFSGRGSLGLLQSLFFSSNTIIRSRAEERHQQEPLRPELQ